MSKTQTKDASKIDIKKYDKSFLEKLLEQMILVRRFEEKAGQMYGMKKIGGFCHLYIGQEAVSTGTIAALDLKSDYVLTGYRDHGHALNCGMDPKSLMAELFGKVTGCSRGKGGSMHMFDAEKHMLGGNGIVGGQIPVATGVAFKIKYLGEKGVVLCYFGDGAIHQGAFHESLNLAKIWQLPVVYICENNMFGMGTHFERVSSTSDFAAMGKSYNIQSKQIEGMDVLEVYEGISDLVKSAREKSEPALLEIKTYRYKGHSMSDPAKYRTKEELEAYKKKDPILILIHQMKEEALIDDNKIEELENKAKLLCDEAVEYAEQSEEPPIGTIYEDILV
ncbi:MAG: pyruvate dehydrogenase (acetyl-transferring) E1 component subunit alpha [Spirochaetales bacterium]|nr:pyruvate dehydrogenase (acetyl-transferring) E1 component subunit alpha [Spirochaetales bacterium]